MRISYLVLKGLPFPGGVERYTEQVGPRLAAKGHQVRVYSISYRTNVPRLHDGMEVRTVPALPWRALEKPSAALLAAARESVGDADIVHVHAFGPSLFGVLPKLGGKKVVIQGHGLEWRRSKWGWAGKSFLRFSEWASVHIPDALTVVSRTQQKYLEERYGATATFIPPGIAPPEPAAPEEIRKLGLAGGDFILFAARLEREKGLEYLIRGYRSLKSGLKLVIAGDNPLDARYKKEMRALAEGDPNIIFTGFATGRLLRELFTNCYLFVLPSELEGLPITVLEAMSYGCACLVSDIPENREAVDGHGFTFRSRDSDDLARQLGPLLKDPGGVRRAGERSRSYVLARFSWDTVADELERLYQETVRSTQPIRPAETS